MYNNIKPLGDKLLVQPIEEEKIDYHGFLVIDKTEDNNNVIKSKVLTIGNETEKVKIGDVVVHNKTTCTPIENNLLIISQLNILATT